MSTNLDGLVSAQINTKQMLAAGIIPVPLKELDLYKYASETPLCTEEDYNVQAEAEIIVRFLQRVMGNRFGSYL